MLILDRCVQNLAWYGALRFVGGRLADHNTAARLEGFLAAHRDRGIQVPDHHVLAAGYSADSAARVLADFQPEGPAGIFVNSTVSLEGVVRWHRTLGTRAAQVRHGCFDWDPFASFLPGNVGMVEQDVSGMLSKAFGFIGNPETPETKCSFPASCTSLIAPLPNVHSYVGPPPRLPSSTVGEIGDGTGVDGAGLVRHTPQKRVIDGSSLPIILWAAI